MRKPVKWCFICHVKRVRHWITVGDYLKTDAITFVLPGIKIGLCDKCHFGDGLFDMSIYRKVEQGLCEIFCQDKKFGCDEITVVVAQSAVKENSDGA